MWNARGTLIVFFCYDIFIAKIIFIAKFTDVKEERKRKGMCSFQCIVHPSTVLNQPTKQ